MENITFGTCYPVMLNPRTFGLTIKAPGGEWQTLKDFRPRFLTKEKEELFFDRAKAVEITPMKTGVGEGVRITLSGWKGENRTLDTSLELVIFQIHRTGELRLEYIPLKEELMEVDEVEWPAPLERVDGSPGCSVFPMMQGMLLYDESPGEIHTFSGGRMLSREAIMPWWGQYTKGGYMAVVDTPWDAKLDYHHLPCTRTTATVKWMSSLGKIRYRRVMHYQFFEDCSYVSMAKEFRSYVLRTEGLTTLKEKIWKNPLVEQLLGMPVVYTPSVLTDCQPESPFYDKENPEKNRVLHPFKELEEGVRRLRGKGLKKAYYHIDGWGKGGYDNFHPDILPPCEEAGGKEELRQLLAFMKETGSLSALHDQYRDYYVRAESYDESNAIQFTDGTLYHVSEWIGGEQAALCTQLAQDYVTRNYDCLEEWQIKPDGVYLDVFSIIELDECDNPRHRMSRKECMEKRIECLESIRARGMIISSEEPMYGFVNHMDLVHHGPYLYALYEVYHIDSPMIPVPLFNLVYHDCLLIPWYLGYDGWGLPPGESGALHGMLNGGLPMVSWEAEDWELETAQVISRLHKQVGCLEMTEHHFLTEHKQKSVFSDGTAVTADFQTGEYEIAYPKEEIIRGIIKASGGN